MAFFFRDRAGQVTTGARISENTTLASGFARSGTVILDGRLGALERR